ncbi:hypothetical protein MOF32_29780, partial [Priestia megaterium]|uniref:hypothetical protein n=1 Tax=Priestia megaterium TaxID=1404 RepID=UPI0022832AFE
CTAYIFLKISGACGFLCELTLKVSVKKERLLWSYLSFLCPRIFKQSKTCYKKAYILNMPVGARSISISPVLFKVQNSYQSKR